MRLKVKIEGSKALMKQFEKYYSDGEDMVAKITKFRAQEIGAEAKRLAPYDTGKLMGNITTQKIDDFNWRITARMPYSAYMEFGTGKMVQVPAEWRDIAEQFRGKGIREVNLAPQPFMYPAFLKARKLFPEDLQQGLDILAKKFNNG